MIEFVDWVAKTLGVELSHFIYEAEGKEYDAARFHLNGRKIVYRKAKRTPKKVGYFVTLWKRNNEGITEPLDETDSFDFACINIENKALFLFSNSVLSKHKIIKSSSSKGKRGFRLYSPLDKTTSLQANRTQSWQVQYYFDTSKQVDIDRLAGILSI